MNPPSWCAEELRGTRTSVCLVSGIRYTTYRTVNGHRRLTGSADIVAINYSYGETNLPSWGNQADVSAYRLWGDGKKAFIGGKASKSGSCKQHESKFPTKKLAPVNSWKLGESFFETTITRHGAKGRCTNKWTLRFTNPSYPPAKSSIKMNEFRCDRATLGRNDIGCVIPWYASPLIYSKSRAPQLASHVTRAQNSGLPGASFKHPLHRTTDEARRKRNRDLACPDGETRPPGKTCDEYPVATSQEGLASGGKRRTFPGCSIPNVPSRTGLKGASACMIHKADQDYQGGKNNAFYRSERMLEGDPFRVLIEN